MKWWDQMPCSSRTTIIRVLPTKLHLIFSPGIPTCGISQSPFVVQVRCIHTGRSDSRQWATQWPPSARQRYTWWMTVLSFCSSVYLSENRCSHLPSNFDHDLLQSPWRRESHATSPRRSPLGFPLTSSFAPSVCFSWPLSPIPQTPLDYTPCAWYCAQCQQCRGRDTVPGSRSSPSIPEISKYTCN